MYDNIVPVGSTTQVILHADSGFILPANITSIIAWTLKTLNSDVVHSWDPDLHGWNIQLDADKEGFYYPGTEIPVAKFVLTVPSDAETGFLTSNIPVYYDLSGLHTSASFVSHTSSSFDFRIQIVEGYTRWRCANGSCEEYQAVTPTEGYATEADCLANCGGSSSGSGSSQSSVSSESSASSNVSGGSSSSGVSESSLGSDSSVGSTSSLASGGSSTGSSGTSGSSASSGSSLSSGSSGSGSSQSSLGSSGSSSSNIPCPPCLPLDIPAISEVNFAGFVVTAPADIPYGTLLQLQVSLDGGTDEESIWFDVGDPVGPNEVVTVSELDESIKMKPMTGYWVRWYQVL